MTNRGSFCRFSRPILCRWLQYSSRRRKDTRTQGHSPNWFTWSLPSRVNCPGSFEAVRACLWNAESAPLSRPSTSSYTGMTLALILLALYFRNGITVDDIGFLIVVVAVVILTTGVIYRAARVLIRFMIPEHWDILPNHH